MLRATAATVASCRTAIASGSRPWPSSAAEGLADRLLLSHDIAMKIQLIAYGGPGYAHLARNLPPFFAARGVDAATLSAIMVDNPARWLTWRAPAES